MYREISWYIADIDNIGIVSYRRLRYRFFHYINIVSVTSEILVIYRYLVILSPTFKRYFKYKMSQAEHLIWQCDISSIFSTSPKRKLRINIGVIDYYVSDNEICELDQSGLP